MQQNFIFRMVLKRLKLHQLFDGWHELFSTQAWVSEGGRNLKISAKKAVFLVVSGEKKIPPLLAPLEKLLKKSTSAPWIKSFRRSCTPV